MRIKNTMETIKYELQSHRGKIIEVPRDYAYFAQKIVNYTITGEGDVVTKGLTTAITNETGGLLTTFAKLADATKGPKIYGEPFEYFSKEALRYQDELYLRICVNLGEKNTDPEGREERKAMNINLIKVVKGLG